MPEGELGLWQLPAGTDVPPKRVHPVQKQPGRGWVAADLQLSSGAQIQIGLLQKVQILRAADPEV